MVGTPALESGRIVAGRYRIERRIGEGGMGSVYLVRHIHTDESLALKVLHAHVLRDESAVQRFRREARAPARIASEHVARVTDADTAPDLDDAPFYVMEYLRGTDLERLLATRGPLAPELCVELLHQTARALDKAHAIGIVHRDLKPENLFLTHRDDGSPCIKLLDFGIARLAAVELPEGLKTQSGYVFGTPSFMAPEQAMGDVDSIGPATDIWALGLVTFKLLVGRDYWGADSLAHLYVMMLREPIRPPSEAGAPFGPAFDAWFGRCVARDVAARFPSAGEAVRALAEALRVRLDAPRRSSASLLPGEPSAAVPSSDAPEALAAPRTSYPHYEAGARSQFAAPPDPPKGRCPGLDTTTKRTRRFYGLVGVGLGGAVVVAALVGFALGLRPGGRGIVATTAASMPSTSSSSPLRDPDKQAATAGSGAARAADSASRGESTPPPAEPDSHAHDVEARAATSTKPAEVPTGRAGNVRATPGDPPLTRDQHRRLETLQRLCEQGTFTPVECKTKRLAILHGDP